MAAATSSAGWISISKNNAEACPAAADGTAVSTDHATASTLTDNVSGHAAATL